MDRRDTSRGRQAACLLRADLDLPVPPLDQVFRTDTLGNALQERVMQRARFESIDTIVALTGNDTLNGVFSRRARELFGVPTSLIAGAQTTGGDKEMIRTNNQMPSAKEKGGIRMRKSSQSRAMPHAGKKRK